jgi:hypothetical protein
MIDNDGDGFAGNTLVDSCDPPSNAVDVAGDCDDDEAATHPAATEVCDGIDNDCDGEVDEEASSVFFLDADGDGFGDDQSPLSACEQPAGYVGNATDCNDDAATTYPYAPELCNEVDDDCNGAVDDNAEGNATWYADDDGDGFGNPLDHLESCTDPGNRVRNDGDCDDAAPSVNPDAIEVCNFIDDDCDALVDEADASDAATWYADADADGYGQDGTALTACTQPSGYSAYAGDCDDTDAAYNPAALELDCTDPNDYNCDGSTGYVDADGDSWAACAECDDANAAIHPAAIEVCDGADNDCDGVVDEADATDVSTWYLDVDADGYGTLSSPLIACDKPAGYVADATDCDDASAAVNPGAVEWCNGIDDDCDGTTDESSAADASTWYADADGDSYGDPAVSTVACDAPADYVADATDCDDGRRLIHPGATEYCNTEDDDCDGSVDEDAADALSYWADDDGDSYGDPSIYLESCSAPSGYVRDDDDCDDADAAINPAGLEICDGLDNDCDGTTDGTSTLYDFDSGISSSIMTLNDDAVVTYSGANGYLALTNLGSYSGGTAWFVDDLDARNFAVSFSFYIHGGSGADGLAFAWLDETDRRSEGALGGYLALQGLDGYAVEFDTYTNSWESSENHVSLINTATFASYSTNTSIPELEDTGWHDATIEMSGGTVDVYLDGTLYISYTIPGYGLEVAMGGFAAASGSLTNYHDIDDVELSCP